MTQYIPLPKKQHATIVYEDPNVLVIDKPTGWLVAPRHWTRTGRNLQRALEAAIEARRHWAMARGLTYLRPVHRLDADTSGLLILARNRRALSRFTLLFQQGRIRKLYLAIVSGTAPCTWQCSLGIELSRSLKPRVRAAACAGKPARTLFWRIGTYQPPGCQPRSIVAAQPLTGRTHQIRAHLAAAGLPVIGDTLYARAAARKETHAQPSAGENVPGPSQYPMALRAIALQYRDPFSSEFKTLVAEAADFLKAFQAPSAVLRAVGDAVENWTKGGDCSASNRLPQPY